MEQNIKNKAALTETFLQKELSDCADQEHLREIMEYAVLNGGKRIRPVLLLSVYELFSEDITKAVPYAAAVEMIHSYSLVHDDLPAMDNDDLRRGKPTCHKQFSEFGAILAGDALLNLGFETMLRYAGEFLPEQSLKVISYIAKASGAKGMCAGQMTDMEQSVTTFEMLCQMYRYKTGALLKASVVAGGLLGGASEDAIMLLEQYADYLGLIFQIQDDILDVISDSKTLGKPILSDAKEHKITFVSQYGIEKCRELMNDYVRKAVACLKQLEELIHKARSTAFLQNLTHYMATRMH